MQVKPTQIGGRPEVCGKGARQYLSGRPTPWPVPSDHCPASPSPPPLPQAASPRKQLGLPLGMRKRPDHRVSAGQGGFPPAPLPLQEALTGISHHETPSYTASARAVRPVWSSNAQTPQPRFLLGSGPPGPEVCVSFSLSLGGDGLVARGGLWGGVSPNPQASRTPPPTFFRATDGGPGVQ